MTLAPFMVPKGTAQTDVISRLFSNFREMVGVLNRAKEESIEKQMKTVNASRHLRQLMPGEVVSVSYTHLTLPTKRIV